MNDFEEGKNLFENEPEEAKKLLDQSIHSFQTAFDFMKITHPQEARSALRNQTEACCKLNTQGAYLKVFNFFQKNFDEANEIIIASDDSKGEIHYLHGLLASHLASTKSSPPFTKLL